jgi:hypothetical protein
MRLWWILPASVVRFLAVVGRVQLRRRLCLSLTMSRVVFPEEASNLTTQMGRVLHRILKLQAART